MTPGSSCLASIRALSPDPAETAMVLKQIRIGTTRGIDTELSGVTGAQTLVDY